MKNLTDRKDFSNRKIGEMNARAFVEQSAILITVSNNEAHNILKKVLSTSVSDLEGGEAGPKP